MTERAIFTEKIAEWHGRASLTVRVYLPHEYAERNLMELSHCFLDARGVEALRDACDEFLAGEERVSDD